MAVLTILLYSIGARGQHLQLIEAALDDNHILTINQELTYFNQSNDTLKHIALNDWNHSYSSNKTNLAQRFSDEFITGFYLSSKNQKGFTQIDSLSNNIVKWNRLHDKSDIIKIYLDKPLNPQEKRTFKLYYKLKLPDDKFTKYGFNNNGYNLKEWFIFPCRYTKDNGFETYSNLNLDDSSNALSNYIITLSYNPSYKVSSDLNYKLLSNNDTLRVIQLQGNNRLNAKVVLETEKSYQSFPTKHVEVITNLKDNRLDSIQKGIVINKVVDYVYKNIGDYPHNSILISQADYSRNPLYGLNQLPSFINPFSDDFQYEIKFLKTYLNIFLKNTLQINQRDDEWLIDGIQMFFVQKYIDEHYPNTKALGDLSNLKIAKSYHLSELKYNEQYHLLYTYMASKNLDQPVGLSKDKLIRFNDKITGKYKAGLSLHYLKSYLDDDTVEKSIRDFYYLSKSGSSTRKDFETYLNHHATKDIRWFFEHMLDKRNILDYSIDHVKTKNDSVTFTITNRTNNTVPIPVYGVTNDSIYFKKWFPKITTDSTFTLASQKAEKLILNYKKEAVEFNLRNNYKRIGKKYYHRPYKFTFFSDIEDPSKKQIFYVPIADYNLYNGIYLGMRLHNKSLIKKDALLTLNPYYSYRSNEVVGSMSFSKNWNFRNQKLFLLRYFISGSQFDYAADAKYTKLNTTLNFFFRKPELRDNFLESIQLKYILINREKSAYAQDEEVMNYGVLNLSYTTSQRELLHNKAFDTDLELAKNFGKITAQFIYKYLFRTNQQLFLRLYGGTFLYRNLDTNYFDFATDRPTDYLFQYNYYGRSESKGIYSQQVIIADGGFKSKLNTPFANQWITTANVVATVYNWFELYGDVGLIKNSNANAQFLYDSGVKLNLVPDFFELYLPIYSSNGLEINQPNYDEKIRFVITISPATLLKLYSRKWF